MEEKKSNEKAAQRVKIEGAERPHQGWSSFGLNRKQVKLNIVNSNQ